MLTFRGKGYKVMYLAPGEGRVYRIKGAIQLKSASHLKDEEKT